MTGDFEAPTRPLPEKYEAEPKTERSPSRIRTEREPEHREPDAKLLASGKYLARLAP